MTKLRVHSTPCFAKWFFPKRIWHGDKSGNEVYLTFDDGPHKEITPWLLEFAKAKGITLNFFWLGKNVVELTTLREKAKNEGHFLANHGFEHLNDIKSDAKAYYHNFEKGSFLFQEKAYRPPYGRLGQTNAMKINKTHRIIMWSWLSYDWDKNISNKKIEKSLQKHLKAGDILVFHESDKTKERFYDLIPKVIEIITKKGLKTASLAKVINSKKQ